MKMQDQKYQAVSLANKYTELAQTHNIKTAKDLSRLTYKLREAGEDILYLAVGTTGINYFPQAISKQKHWKWINNQDIGEGFIGFYVHVLPNGYRIEVYQLGQKTTIGVARERISLFDKTFIF